MCGLDKASSLNKAESYKWPQSEAADQPVRDAGSDFKGNFPMCIAVYCRFSHSLRLSGTCPVRLLATSPAVAPHAVLANGLLEKAQVCL